MYSEKKFIHWLITYYFYWLLLLLFFISPETNSNYLCEIIRSLKAALVACIVSIALHKGLTEYVSLEVTGNHLKIPGSGWLVDKTVLSSHRDANSLLASFSLLTDVTLFLGAGLEKRKFWTLFTRWYLTKNLSVKIKYVQNKDLGHSMRIHVDLFLKILPNTTVHDCWKFLKFFKEAHGSFELLVMADNFRVN